MGGEASAAGRGFVGGFMGCFGVLAAFALVGFGLLVWNAALTVHLSAKGVVSGRFCKIPGYGLVMARW
jgi:hypothetical protein